MKTAILLLLAAIAPAAAQTYNIITVAPNPAASAVGQLKFAVKSNSPTRHTLSFEGPDTLGANVRYKFDGTTTAGCLSLGAASGGINTITTGGCVSWPLVVPNGTAANQIDASGLGGALNIGGSSTVNGDIVFNPGNVAGNAATFFNTPRLDWPGVIIQNATGTTTGDVFEIWDSSGAAQVRVTGSGNSTAPSSLFLGLPTSSLGLVGPSLVVQNVIASLTAPTNASGISMAATPSSGGADLSVFKTGSGTLLPLRFFRNPNELARFDTNNNFLIGRTSDDGTSSLVQVAGPTSIGGALIPASTTTYQLGTSSKVWSHTWTSDLTVESHLILTGVGSPQIDATGTGAALNINGSSSVNGDIVLNPGTAVAGSALVQINGQGNSNVQTLPLVINETQAGVLGTGITLKHSGTFDAAWNAGVSAGFDVVGNGGTHLFVLDQSGLATRYHAVATAGMGLAPICSVVNVTGATGSLGATNLLVGGATPPAGVYRVTGYIVVTTAGSGTVNMNVTWDSGVGSNTQIVGTNLGFLGGAATIGGIVFSTDGTHQITFSTTYSGSGTYSTYAQLERLQ